MEKLHAFVALMKAHPTTSVVVGIVILGVIDQLVRLAKWTTAEGVFEFLARVLLKIPLIGTVAVSVPVAGYVLYRMANDPENTPPNLGTRLQRRRTRRKTLAKVAAAVSKVETAADSNEEKK